MRTANQSPLCNGKSSFNLRCIIFISILIFLNLSFLFDFLFVFHIWHFKESNHSINLGFDIRNLCVHLSHVCVHISLVCLHSSHLCAHLFFQISNGLGHGSLDGGGDALILIGNVFSLLGKNSCNST